MKITPFFFVLSLLTLNVSADPAADLRQACAAKSAETPVVKGSDGWLFLPAELRHVAAGKFWGEDAVKVSKSTKPENADPLPAILDFKSQLDKAGVELILVPVPAKAFVYPEAVSGGTTTGAAPARLDTFHQQFYDELRKNGVTVVDLLPDLLAGRNGGKGTLFCKQDTHWSGAATVLAAEKISALLKDKPWVKEAARIKTVTEEKEVEISGDLLGMLTSDKPAKEKLKLRFVGLEGSGISSPIKPDATSPLVLLGDSHTLVFNSGGDMLASGAGLADQLSNDLGMSVDLIGVRGSGATPARINLMRRAKADAAYLKNKKAIVWCFTVREFTEASGWSKVPLTKE